MHLTLPIIRIERYSMELAREATSIKMECCNDASVSSTNILQCSVCGGKYHYECLGLTSNRFVALKDEYKAAWKCHSCGNVTRRARSNINTPVRSYAELPADDHTMDMSCDNLDHSHLSSSTSLGGNRTLITEKSSQPSISADFEAFTINLQTTLSQWRSDMNKDILQIRDDIRSTLTGIRKDMQVLRTEQTLLKQQVSTLRDDINDLQTGSQNQTAEHETLKKRVDDLSCNTSSAEFESTICSLETKIDVLEQQARQCNVEICNLPERRNEHLPSIIEAIGNVLKSPISLNHIVAVHRVPHAHQQSTRPKNIILKFTSRLQRDNLLSAYRKANSLKTEQIGMSGASTSIYINEHLTLKRKQLFRRTREVANNHNHKYVWIRNGTILVRERDGETAFAIRGEGDLNKIKKKTTD